MSSFLVNLARRGAGLPATTIQAPPPSPFGPEIGRPMDAVTETPGTARDLAIAETPNTGHTAMQAPWHASASEEHAEPSPGTPGQHMPAIQRLSGPEPSTPTQPSVAAPAAINRTPLLEPRLTAPEYVLPNTREAQATPMERPQPLGLAVPPYPTERADSTERDVGRDLHTQSSVV